MLIHNIILHNYIKQYISVQPFRNYSVLQSFLQPHQIRSWHAFEASDVMSLIIGLQNWVCDSNTFAQSAESAAVELRSLFIKLLLFPTFIILFSCDFHEGRQHFITLLMLAWNFAF